jgi:hypothetical protein
VIAGCRDYLRKGDGGLQYPEDVTKATADYNAESDVVQAFIEECCVNAGEYQLRPLHDAFCRWGGTLAEKAFS